MRVQVSSVEEAAVCLADPAVEHIQLPFSLLDWRARCPSIFISWRKPPRHPGHASEMKIYPRTATQPGSVRSTADQT